MAKTKAKPKSKSKKKGTSSGKSSKKKKAWVENILKPKIENPALIVAAVSIGIGAIAAYAIGKKFNVATAAAIGAIGALTGQPYVVLGATSMLFTNPIVNGSEQPKDEISGLSGPNFIEGAKTRVGSFFTLFKDKFKLPSTSQQETPVNGFGATEVYQSLPENHMSSLERIEKELVSMNGTENSYDELNDLNDLPDREL